MYISYWPIDRQTDRPIDRQTDRQTDDAEPSLIIAPQQAPSLPRLAPLLKGHWWAATPLTVLLACIASCIFDGEVCHVISCHSTSQYKKNKAMHFYKRRVN